MTLQEIRQLAKAYGYRLIKVGKRITKAHCTCGADIRHVHLWVDGDHEWHYECAFCGKVGATGNSEIHALINWNEANGVCVND